MSPLIVRETDGSIFDEEAEERRLEALRRYDILDTPSDEAFDRLTRLAADLFDVGIAFVGFLDRDRQWFKSSVGLDQKESSLAASYCSHTIEEGHLLVIEDAVEDDRTNTSPFLTEEGLRFYAGVPIRTPEGEAIGTFSIMDAAPRSLSATQRNRLEDMAQMAAEELERRQEARRHEQVAQRFEAIFEDPRMLVGVLTPDGTLVEANATSLQYIEASEEEVLGTPFWETPWWPDAMEEQIRSWVEAAAGGAYVEKEVDLEGPTGERYSVEGTIRPVEGRDGVEALVVSAQDVTGRKRREQELRQQKSLLEQTQRLAGAWETDLRTGEVFWSDKVYEIHDIDPGTELDVEAVFDMVEPEARSRVRAAFERCADEGVPYDLELPIVTAEGNRRWVRTVGGPVETEAGEITKVTGALQDVTERKRYERELERYREYTDEILDAIDDIFYILGSEGELERWNQSLAAVTGYSNEEISSMQGAKLFADKQPGEIMSSIEEVFDTGTAVVEGHLRTKDGQQIPYEFVATRVEAPDGREKVAGIGRDITDRKRREQDLKHRQKKVEAFYDAANGLLQASSAEEVGTLIVDLIRETIGYPGVSVRFARGGQLVPVCVSPEMKALRPDCRSHSIDEETGVASVYREKQSMTVEGAGRREREEGREDDEGAAVVVPMGTHGVIEAVDPRGGEIDAFDTHLMEGLGTHAAAVLDRIAQEEEVRGTKKFYEQVLEQVPIELAVFRPDATFEYVNSQGISDPDRQEWLLGHTNEEYFRKRGLDPEIGRRRDAVIRRTAREGRPIEFEETLETDDGARHYLRAHGPVMNTDGEVTHVTGFGIEITEQKERRERLEKYREYTDRLLNASDDLFFVVDAEGMLQRWNEQLSDVTGYPDEALRGMNALRFIAEEHREQTMRAVDEVFETGHSQIEASVRTSDGTTVPYEFTGNRVEHPDGGVRLVGIGRDVTERTHREEALQDRRRKVEVLYKAMRGLLVAERPEDVSRHVHEMTEEVFDFPFTGVYFVQDDVLVPQDVTLKPGSRMPDPAPIDVESESLLGTAHRSGETTVVEDLSTLKDEGVRDDAMEYGELRSALGVPIGDYGVVMIGKTQAEAFNPFDLRLIEVLSGYAAAVLDRLDRESSLREERDLLDRLLATSPAAVVLLDEEGDFVRANDRAEEILGIEKDEVTERAFNDPEWGITALDGRPLPDEELPFARVLSTGEPVRDFEHAIEWPDGTRRILSVSGAPLHGGTEGQIEGAVFHISDVTEQRRREQELIQAKEEAERASRLKTAVLANMSHEIRTPLTSIRGFSELLTDNLEGTMQTFATRIFESSERLMRTLDSVLQLSRLEAGVYEMERESVSLGRLVEETTEMLLIEARKTGVDLQVDLPDTPIEGEWNEGALARIIENLLENGIKFTPDGGTVWIRAYEEEAEAVLEVEDTGIGIHEEALSRVFEPFQQESEGRMREYEGTGLGLSIVRRLTEGLGGTVEVDSEKGTGTCFTVRLPFDRNPDG